MKILFLIPLLFTICFAQKMQVENTPTPKPVIQGYMLTQMNPFIDSLVDDVWLVSHYEPNISRIYYYNNQTLLQSSYNLQKSKMFWGVEIENSDWQSVFRNLGFSDTGVNCVYVDSNLFEGYKLINKDSCLKTEIAFSNPVDKLLNQMRYKETFRGYDTSGSSTGTYQFININDSTHIGHFVCTFQNQPPEYCPYILSQRIEKETGLKLAKIAFVSYPRFFAEDSANIGKIEISWKLEKITVDNTEELMKLFDLERAVNKRL